jgi:acetyl esterase/lipase
MRLLALAAVLCALSGCLLIGPPRAVTHPDGVDIARDLTYATVGKRELKLDLYTPHDAKRPLPLIVWVYGGGWLTGDKDPCLIARFALHGYAIASIEYRLSGEAIWPAQIHDCKAAVRWLRAHAAEHGIDPERIGVWGASAGGHLACLLGTSQDPALEGDEGVTDVSSRVAGVCAFFPATDLLALDTDPDQDGRIRYAMKKLLGGPVAEKAELARQASPVTWVDATDPPFLLIHGDEDSVIPLDQSRRLARALAEAHVPCELREIHGVGHGNAMIARQDVRDAAGAFFDRVLARPAASGPAPRPPP